MTIPQMTAERTDSIRRMLTATVRNEPGARRVRARKRFAVWGGIGILSVGAMSFAGTAILAPSKVSNEGIVHCLESHERGVNGKIKETMATVSVGSSGRGRVADATALCTTMWKQGVFQPGYDASNVTNTPGEVPAHLSVCVEADGSAAVVPGTTEVCAGLGLAPLTAD